jgi:hypothetical protein
VCLDAKIARLRGKNKSCIPLTRPLVHYRRGISLNLHLQNAYKPAFLLLQIAIPAYGFLQALQLIFTMLVSRHLESIANLLATQVRYNMRSSSNTTDCTVPYYIR